MADGEPDIGVNANVGARKLSDTDYEVLLKFRVEAKSGEDVQFIAELNIAACFRLINVPENNTKPVLLIEAPRQLFLSPAVSLPMRPAMAAIRRFCWIRLISWRYINKRPSDAKPKRPKVRPARKTARRLTSRANRASSPVMPF